MGLATPAQHGGAARELDLRAPRRARASTGRAVLGAIGALALLLAGLVAWLVLLRPEAPPATAAVEPTATSSAALEESSSSPAPVAVDDEARSTNIAPSPPETAKSSSAALRVSVESARGVPWSGPFELWLAHVPTPGRPTLMKGAYRAQIGPRVDVGDLAPGRYRGWARASARRSSTFSVDVATSPTPTEVVLILAPAGVIAGQLVSEDGSPVDGVRVTVERASEVVESALSDELGRFRFESVLDGEYELSVGPKAAPLLPTTPLNHVGVETDLGVITVPGLARLAILVVDPTNRPIAGARVWDGDILGHFDLRTDERGSCVVRHLPAVQVRVFVEDSVHGRANRPVKLEAGRESRLEIRLPQ